MKNKFLKLFLLVVVLAAGFFAYGKLKPAAKDGLVTREVAVVSGSIEKYISATAIVQPQNRLEIKPPIPGRIDKIMVSEGQKVSTGQVLAYMSSTERAALLDAARSKGEKELAYWEEVYKPIPLTAPIDGEVIVQTLQPGQTVTAADPIVVLSDRLIVQAQVDETDIGRILRGQRAVITLDAYPDVVVDAVVGHIYYESKTVNNVTIYQVDVLPDEIPPVFRSGMSANVKIIQEKKGPILLIPQEALKRSPEGSHVLVKGAGIGALDKRKVETGLSDDTNIEIVSGLSEGERVIIQTKKYTAPRSAAQGTNPLAPSRGPQRSRESRPAA